MLGTCDDSQRVAECHGAVMKQLVLISFSSLSRWIAFPINSALPNAFKEALPQNVADPSYNPTYKKSRTFLALLGHLPESFHTTSTNRS